MDDADANDGGIGADVAAIDESATRLCESDANANPKHADDGAHDGPVAARHESNDINAVDGIVNGGLVAADAVVILAPANTAAVSTAPAT